MNNQIFDNSTVNNFLNLEIDGIRALIALALDLGGSWNHSADIFWRKLDPNLWDLTHNPWMILRTVSNEKLKALLVDPTFRAHLDALSKDQKLKVESSWFQQKYPKTALKGIAYFSMEFMLSEALPIYSGGLGNVAGDQLKAASDLGVPVVGIGLLYQQGYFRQVIDKDGWQQPYYPYNNPAQLPIAPLRKPNGEWLRIEIKFPGYSFWFQTWQVQVGRVRLLLLDSNDPANLPAHRGITSELYGGNSELRLKQELLLGIGGWRLLDALGIDPDVCHLNEGHAAFAVLERARSFMNKNDLSFEKSLEVTRAGNLFTTHTAVAAGFDRFCPELMEQYLKNYAQNQLNISLEDLLALGRLNRNDPDEYFNMAYLAIRGSGAINAVSRLHGQVSRKIFEPLFPRWPTEDIPVNYVTNGVHMPSWDSIASDALWTKACGKERWKEKPEVLEQAFRQIPLADIWQMRNVERNELVEFARDRLEKQMAALGIAPEIIKVAKARFNPHVLTLGFARRFATYKRPNLLLHDQKRLLDILNHPQYPVQLIIAGKAHPADKPGQALIQAWAAFISRPEVQGKVIFLNDYDMYLTEQLVQGVDVWINTPRRPWEACGTSGMKVLVNGGLNLSELDGWWVEAYSPAVGWALGDGQEHDADPSWDALEANALYNLLENEVIVEFYKRNSEGIPLAWVERIKTSMASLTPQYSASRAVQQYVEGYYLPAALKYTQRAAQQGLLGQQIVAWKKSLEQNWSNLRFGAVKIETDQQKHVFEVQLYGSAPQSIQVELFAGESQTQAPFIQKMELVQPFPQENGACLYRGAVALNRPAEDYTLRVVPYFPGVAVPLESSYILWQR